MDKPFFEYLDDSKYQFILEGDPRLKIFEIIATFAERSNRHVDMYWPRTIWDYYIEKGRITYRQYNVLLGVYEKECAIERAMEEREKTLNFEKKNEEEEKIIHLKFA